jgi:glucose/arabinose dehydrogenase
MFMLALLAAELAGSSAVGWIAVCAVIVAYIFGGFAFNLARIYRGWRASRSIVVLSEAEWRRLSGRGGSMVRGACALYAVILIAVTAFLVADRLSLNVECAGGLPVKQLHGDFNATLLTDKVPGARTLVGVDDLVIVGTRHAGAVYAVYLDSGAVRTIASDLQQPNGIAVLGDDVYIAQIQDILVVRGLISALRRGDDDLPKPELVTSYSLPPSAHHEWRYMTPSAAGDALYIAIGAPCNVCSADAAEPRYATILRLSVVNGTIVPPTTPGDEVFATGIRNSVGMIEEAGVLYFTENGRDHLGNDLPPDELNGAPVSGLDYGFPYCYGAASTRDLTFEPDLDINCTQRTGALVDLPPHAAALGLLIVPDTDAFPAWARRGIVYAEHGSWNMVDDYNGYRLAFLGASEGVRRAAGRSFDSPTDLWPWSLADGTHCGRPVDVTLVLGDTAIVVSDDVGGRLYLLKKAPVKE